MLHLSLDAIFVVMDFLLNDCVMLLNLSRKNQITNDVDKTRYIILIATGSGQLSYYCRRHLFWFPFFGFFSMKSCTDLLNLNISQ